MKLQHAYYLLMATILSGQAWAEQVVPRPPSPATGPAVQIQALDTPPDFAPVGDSPTADAESTERLAIVGRPVQNLQGQLLGEVDGVLVSADGRVQSVVLAMGGLMGWGQDRYEVPWARVHWQRDGDYLTLDVGPQEVKAEFSAFETD